MNGKINLLYFSHINVTDFLLTGDVSEKIFDIIVTERVFN